MSILVTGAAGFIGSHVVRALLARGEAVLGIDNFSDYYDPVLKFARLKPLREIAGFTFLEADIADREAMHGLVGGHRGIDRIVHLAAQPGVRHSLVDPYVYVQTNVMGHLVMLELARRLTGLKHFVYASSSSVYGDRPELPKREDQPPAPISPYAVSKAAGEQYAAVWHRLYGVETVGLRYFNVFGPRQDPASEYAAVIPRFILWALRGQPLEVHGDGRQSRDFTYIDNVVDANCRAAEAPEAAGVFNVGCGDRVSLLDIVARLETLVGHPLERRHSPSRAGDVLHTLADIERAGKGLGYTPMVGFDEGLRRTFDYFRRSL